MDFYLVQLFYSLYKIIVYDDSKIFIFLIQSFWIYIYRVCWNNKYLFIYVLSHHVVRTSGISPSLCVMSQSSSDTVALQDVWITSISSYPWWDDCTPSSRGCWCPLAGLRMRDTSLGATRTIAIENIPAKFCTIENIRYNFICHDSGYWLSNCVFLTSFM